MKTYIITEKDIETLTQLFPDLGEGLTVNRIVEDWVETLNELPTPKKLDLSCDTPEDFYINRANYFVTLELDKDKTEFAKFIEEYNFIKPEQPYYVRKGEIFDYGDLRQLFLESKNSAERK